MDTSVSAGTLASGASTAFYSQQVHFFSLDDFAGHEIQTILEDGENDHQNDHHDENGRSQDGQSQGDNQSVRPGSIVSNIEQRLDELDGLGPAELISETLLADQHSCASDEPSGSGSTSATAAAEAQYLGLLEQMQHRDLTPEDLQLLMMIEKERAERHRRVQPITGPSTWGSGSMSPWAGASSSSWSNAPTGDSNWSWPSSSGTTWGSSIATPSSSGARIAASSCNTVSQYHEGSGGDQGSGSGGRQC